MPSHRTDPANAFGARLRALEATRQQVDSLFESGRLSRRAIDHIYEGLFISAVAAFEVFIEELFLRLLVRRPQKSTNVHPRIRVNSFLVARTVVAAGRNYADWLPYNDHTAKRAKIYFRAGRPFTTLPSQQTDVLQRITMIRNLIAHRSRHSQQQFEKHVIGNTPLTPRERRPGAFLRGILTPEPMETRFQNYASTLGQAAHKLTLVPGPAGRSRADVLAVKARPGQ